MTKLLIVFRNCSANVPRNWHLETSYLSAEQFGASLAACLVTDTCALQPSDER
jgi:hypothetical protein